MFRTSLKESHGDTQNKHKKPHSDTPTQIKSLPDASLQLSDSALWKKGPPRFAT